MERAAAMATAQRARNEVDRAAISRTTSMSTDQTLAERIDQLEMRIAYQDQTLEELNQVITDQWKQVNNLKRQMARLEEQMSQAPVGGAPAQEPPPPHY
jgi:SlyX protein